MFLVVGQNRRLLVKMTTYTRDCLALLSVSYCFKSVQFRYWSEWEVDGVGSTSFLYWPKAGRLLKGGHLLESGRLFQESGTVCTNTWRLTLTASCFHYPFMFLWVGGYSKKSICIFIESKSVTSQKLKVLKLWDMIRYSERASWKMPACQKSASYFIFGVRYEHFHALMTPCKPF